MSKNLFSLAIGPFGASEQKATEFSNNLFFSHMIAAAAAQLKKSKEEYEKAIVARDVCVMEQKKIEIEACECSLRLTCTIFEEVDDISA